jgi:phenylacetate-coenzyme A ligase PaaK-like adenylate-forming protein
MRPAVAKWSAQHESASSLQEIANRQLDALNLAWPRALSRSPFARAIRDAYGIPEGFESWHHFDSIVPVMDKRSLRAALNCVSSGTSHDRNVIWRATGGSTGEPFRFPTYHEEHAAAALDIWLGRSRLGIDPEEPLFLLWGHAHLLGSGFKGKVNRLRRRVSDALLGYTRASAYDLTDEALAAACDSLLVARPAYVVGYSCALDRFARVNAGRASEIASISLKAVIATAEGFPMQDSRERVSATFGAPVFMEYGTVETGPLAYERSDGRFDVFHVRHRLSLRGGTGPAADEILVTSLDMRAMPLMRYAIGDLVVTDPGHVAEGSVLGISRVIGRCNDMVELPSGAQLHSEVFTHCLRDIPTIDRFQVVVPQDGGWPRLRYVAKAILPDGAIAEVRRRLAVIRPELATMALEWVEDLPLSVSGKHRMVVEG